MAATTVDYMISIVIVTGLLATSIVITGQTLNTALVYQQDQQTSIEASSILNNILQSHGEPKDWGENTTEPSAFGLRWPLVESVMPNPFTPMRLMRTGKTTPFNSVSYRNLSTADGLTLFLKEDDYVDYDTVSELLAVNGIYGFNLTIKPILNVSIIQNVSQADLLKLNVNVSSLSGPLSDAILNATLFYVKDEGTYPSIESNMSSAVSDITGEAEVEFPIGGWTEDTPYFALVRVNHGGLSGVGYCTNTNSSDSKIIPIVSDYESATVSLIATDSTQNYNLTFILSGRTGFTPQIMGTGTVDPSQPKNISLKVGQFKTSPGVLLVSFNSTSEYGLTAMPWGISPLGLSLSFGGDPSYRKTVVTKSLNVAINRISYQVELALWRLKG